MQRNRVNQMHSVTATGQRQSVNASSAADIKQAGWWWRQMPLHDLPRTDPLKPAKRRRQSLLFLTCTVVIQDFGGNHCDSLTERVAALAVGVSSRASNAGGTTDVRMIVTGPDRCNTHSDIRRLA